MPTPFVWSPSRDRTIALFDTVGHAPRGRLATVLPLRWPSMPLGATADVSLDACALQASDSDTIGLTINAIGSGLALLASVVNGGLITLWLTAQACGDTTIDLTLTTQSTRRVHRIIRLHVQ